MSAKPEAGEEVLHKNHAQSDHHGVSGAKLIIASKAIATEDGTTNDGLQQIVGETHATEDAQVMEHAADALERIPCRHHTRDNHQEDDETVDGVEPRLKAAESDKAQRDGEY
jgi:hypothetical protein